ncbi:uncharacterized protein BBOV_IV007340 [Babesia bovis T2Bo]|uniref:CNH domain-containing protein n=1 Tax=Babesia bovis TaxID=5865 RepID=A7ARC1_BABBO|nr:uncharacterized protein BBOV_IV007340 [Babesia bovis T2Bo]EDO07090.1 hypothetical protein BBOV_IV007340 [Babesia bovis T2Bo]|eukprot:XP_001610658.1 hypothetical protein [Babesia bovis T2Bo]
MMSDEVADASRRLSGLEIPVFSMLESQMGDPVLSHWIGPDGVVAGTALGRISAYLFDIPSSVNSDLSTVTVEKPMDTPSPPITSESDDPSPPSGDAAIATVDLPTASPPEDSPNNDAPLVPPQESHSDAVYIGMEDSLYEGDEDHGSSGGFRFKQLTSLCVSFMSYLRCGSNGISKSSICDVLPGRYTVFASFSNEAVRAVFINNRLLYCLIGTTAIAVYDVDKYALRNEYRLSLSRNAGYKQITFSGCKILVDCMRGSTILDPVAKTQISSTHRVYPSNVLDFNGSEMMCYYRNINKYFVQVITLDNDSTKKVLFSIAMPKSVYLVTHGKFWGRDRIVVVADMLMITVFNHRMLTVPVAKRRLRVDIMALCGGFRDFLAVLTKDANLLLLHGRTLETFHSISLYPATFELGWPYSLINYNRILSFTSDEGVYCLKLPSKVLTVASEWQVKDNSNDVGTDTDPTTTSTL